MPSHVNIAKNPRVAFALKISGNSTGSQPVELINNDTAF